MICLAEVLHTMYGALQEFEFQKSGRYWLELAKRCLNEAQTEVQIDVYLASGRLLRLYEKVATTSIDSGGWTVAYPTDLQGNFVYTVSRQNTDATKKRTLDFTSQTALDRLNRDWQVKPVGIPNRWFHYREKGKVGFYPPADTSDYDKAIIHYMPTLTKFYRYWGTFDTGTPTINVQNGNTAATLSAAASSDEFASGDYIGVILPKPSDTTAIEQRSAMRFYLASEVSDTAVTLSSAYEESDDSAAFFVTGQAIELLAGYEELGWALVFRANQRLMESVGEDEAAEKFRAKAERAIVEFVGRHKRRDEARRQIDILHSAP